MSAQLLARSFLMAGVSSRCSVRAGRCDALLRPRRESLRLSCGRWTWLTEASVVMWNTSRTLFSETLDVHSVYATAPIWRARVLPCKTQQQEGEGRRF